jgi:hypothetical protein
MTGRSEPVPLAGSTSPKSRVHRLALVSMPSHAVNEISIPIRRSYVKGYGYGCHDFLSFLYLSSYKMEYAVGMAHADFS